MESKKPQTPQSCPARGGCDAAPTGASRVTRDSVRPKQNSTPGSGGSSTGEAAPVTLTLTTWSPKTRQESVRRCVEDKDGVKAKHSEAKQKRRSSPGEEKLFSCPMCALVCSSCFILQEHVELHLQEQRAAEGSTLEACPLSPSASSLSGEKRFECPMCSVVCSDSFSLQEHVELHLDHGAAVNSAGSPGSDLKLARQIQQGEEQRRRLEEDQQEREEFKKLQVWSEHCMNITRPNARTPSTCG